MKSNNPFKVHNINYLSPSSINTYISDMPMWITRYLYGVKSSSGASAVRGIAEEFALANKYEKGVFDFKERKILKDFGKVIDENFNHKNLVAYQEKVEVQFDDLPVPVMGYIDFRFTDKIVDLKTSTRMPSKPTEAQKRQMALYSMAYPDSSVDLFFATPKECKTFTLTDLSQYKDQLKKVAFSIQKFLSISDDRHELASLVHPNLDSWMWSGEMVEQAKKIWSIK